MIVVCKHRKIPGRLSRLSEEYINITIGKHYEIFTDFYDADIMVEIVDDSVGKYWYPKNNFSPLQVERELQIDKIIK